MTHARLMATATVAALMPMAASAGIIFQQDFSSSSSVASYVSASPDSGQVNDISADGTYSTVSVNAGQLVFDMDADPDTNTPPSRNAGLLRSTDIASPVPTLVRMELTLTYARDDSASNYGPGPAFQVGNFPASATSYGGTVGNDRFDDIGFRRNGANSFWVELSTTERVAANFGQEITLTYLLNDSGSDAEYLGPDGNAYTLNPLKVALFVNNTLVGNNHAAANGGLSDLSTFRFTALDNSDTSLSINQITVHDDLGVVPEPAAGLTALFGLATLSLRRRRTT